LPFGIAHEKPKLDGDPIGRGSLRHHPHAHGYTLAPFAAPENGERQLLANRCRGNQAL
jgi:hypothetical protein